MQGGRAGRRAGREWEGRLMWLMLHDVGEEVMVLLAERAGVCAM